jgi:hypothetical protein
MANWYNELKEICLDQEFQAIAVRKNEYTNDKHVKVFQSLGEAKFLLDYEFDDGYGGTEGPYFTMWTKDRVYFPSCYDGAEWISSVPRNPAGESTEHIGGG